jgi:hypothetical protein
MISSLATINEGRGYTDSDGRQNLHGNTNQTENSRSEL